MPHIDLNGVSYSLPDGRPLLRDVSFKVDEGSVTALVGPNGSGKTTLFGLVAGYLEPEEGSISVSGTLAVMEQFVGKVRDATTVRELLLRFSPAGVRAAARRRADAEAALASDGTERAQLAYAQALADWGDLGGYETELAWDVCTTEALGLPFEEAGRRPVATLSGGEQKRLVLHFLLASPADLLALDEPDNFLDVPSKEWLESELAATRKTVLLVSHDRELLRRSATRVVTLEPNPAGASAWVHGGGFEGYHDARSARLERLAELRKRWDEEVSHLKAIVAEYRRKASYNSDFAPKLRSAENRLQRFVQEGPPEEVPRPRRLSMRLRGARTGKRVVTCSRLGLTGLAEPFDLEVHFGERVAVLGPNGSGKTHLLRLLAEGGSEGSPTVAHSGRATLGARVQPGLFAQTHDHPELVGLTLTDLLGRHHDLPPERAIAALGRYELARARNQRFETLSGGQQARLQILLLELSGATLLLLDEPTDNLDVESAEALETGLDCYEGTVLAVTHDRYFARSFDRFLFFSASGRVVETPSPVWSEPRARARRGAPPTASARVREGR